jgi:hypothetical protein
MDEQRRFPAPWKVTESGESFQVVDANGFVLTGVYCEDNQSRGDQVIAQTMAPMIATQITRPAIIAASRQQSFAPKVGLSALDLAGKTAMRRASMEPKMAALAVTAAMSSYA